MRKSINNLGIATSIISGLDWIASKEESFFVIEDDLEIHSDFFTFALDMLTKYRSQGNVMMISGNRFSHNEEQGFRVSWTNYSQTWGWATWADRWKELRVSALRDVTSSKYISLNKVHNFWEYGNRRVMAGLLDTWDIPISFYMYKLNRLCLLPPVNLVRNVGFDSFSTHTSNSQFPMNQATSDLPGYYEFVEPSKSLLEQENAFLESQVFRIPMRAKYLPFYHSLYSKIDGQKTRLSLAKKLSDLEDTQFLFLQY